MSTLNPKCCRVFCRDRHDGQAADEAELNAKRLFFNQLSALDERSDEEHDTNHIRKKLAPFPTFSMEITATRNRTPFTLYKAPGKQRTTAAPTSSDSLIKETPQVPKVSSSRHSDPTALLSAETSVINDTPEPKPHAELRTASNPTLGTDSLVLNNSTGIEFMLGKRNRAGLGFLNEKKKLRKKPSVEFVPEDKQIFRGQEFYYVPSDDKSQLRKYRINKARSFGATWTRELGPSTTHIVVDKGITFKDVMAYLKLETLPSNIKMVSEEYPIDSIKWRFLLDPTQKQYAVSGYGDTLKDGAGPQARSQTSNSALELKSSISEPGAGGDIPLEKMPPRSEKSTQASGSIESASRVLVNASQDAWMAQKGRYDNSAIVESPHEIHHYKGAAYADKEPAWICDDFEEMIRVAQSMEDVPIDDDEDDREDDRPPSRDQADDSSSGDDSRHPPSRGVSTSRRKGFTEGSFNQQTFRCMTGGTGVTPEFNPNWRTIEILQKMADYYVETEDHWRQTAYRKTIGVLRKQHAKISTYEEAFCLPTIGHRLALKIEEIVLTNGLRRLTDALSDPNYHTLHTFVNIYGVGISKAWKWVQQGHRTLEDLKTHVNLTKNQLLGVEHYDEFLTRIPRDEVTALGNIVKAAAAIIDPEVEIIIGGSYRRGTSSSGDIDFILTKRSTTLSEELLEFLTKLTIQLTESGFLVAALAMPSQTGSKWHGCCVLPGTPKPIWRRIDLLLVPETQLGAALIYFTGDDIFNRSIRLLAIKKGWRLNQRGLYKDVLRGPGRLKLNEGSLIEGAEEKKIFAALGLPWRPPEQRICQ